MVSEWTDISWVLKTGPSIGTLQALRFSVWTKRLPPCAFCVALEDSALLKFMFAYNRRLVWAAVTTRDGTLTLLISSKHACIFLGRVELVQSGCAMVMNEMQWWPERKRNGGLYSSPINPGKARSSTSSWVDTCISTEAGQVHSSRNSRGCVAAPGL